MQIRHDNKIIVVVADEHERVRQGHVWGHPSAGVSDSSQNQKGHHQKLGLRRGPAPFSVGLFTKQRVDLIASPRAVDEIQRVPSRS